MWKQLTAECANPVMIDAPPAVQSSPTLQKWLKQTPDVRLDIRNDPAFRTKLRIGYAKSALQLGWEDQRLGQSRTTSSFGYEGNFADRQSLAADLHYQLLPLGSVVNFAPTIGVRRIVRNDDGLTGLNLGWRARVNLSRGGGADLVWDQSFVAPGQARETGVTRLSISYAIAPHWRIAADWQRQQSQTARDRRFGVAIEWLK
jgi:hypothetical protein